MIIDKSYYSTYQDSLPPGLPSAAQVEEWANAYFPGFDVQACGEGIDRLMRDGDTSVLQTAAGKAENYLGKFTLGEQDYLDILNEVIGQEQSISDTQNEAVGFAPMVVSQQEAENRRQINVSHGSSQGQNSSSTGLGFSKNSGIIVGTKSLEDIRKDFPILSEKVNGHNLVWLDNGATTQKPQAVIDRLSYFYQHENSNVHRGAHELAARSTDAYEGARQIVADFIGAPDKNNIIFVRGTTEGINLVAHAYVKQYLSLINI